jgi:hypothetical protein
MSPFLQEALDAMPKSDMLCFLTTDHGKPFASAAAFGNKFADWSVAEGYSRLNAMTGRSGISALTVFVKPPFISFGSLEARQRKCSRLVVTEALLSCKSTFRKLSKMIRQSPQWRWLPLSQKVRIKNAR